MTTQFPATAGVVDAIVFNPLWLPGHNPRFENYTILAGQNLAAGSVLGLITASGKLVLSLLAAGDGSQAPMAVLAHDIKTYDIDGVTGLDMKASVIVDEAYLNETALIIGTGHTVATVKDAFRPLGMLLRAPGFSG
jgi:hypothetical protein